MIDWLMIKRLIIEWVMSECSRESPTAGFLTLVRETINQRRVVSGN